MTEERGILRAVDWRSLLPWVLLFRLFKPATSFTAMAMATAALVVWPVGWKAAHVLFLSDEQLEADPQLAVAVEINESLLPPFVSRVPEILGGTPFTASNLVAYTQYRAASEATFVFYRFFTPLERLSFAAAVTEWAYLLFGLLWSLFVWSFAGGFIARSALTVLGCEQREDALDTMRLTVRRLPSLVGAPLFPLLGAFLLALIIAVGGLFMRIPADIFPFLGSLFWWLAILISLAISYLLLGFSFGWPLMVPAAMAETIDAFDPFDPVSRSFSYTTQKPLHYLFFACVAALVGGLALLLVIGFSEVVILVAHTATAVGMGSGNLRDVHAAAAASDSSSLAYAAGNVLHFWIGLVRLVAHAFLYSFFWCAAAGIYLLLRQTTDQTEVDEIYFADEEEGYALPPIDIERPTTTEPARTGDSAASASSDKPAEEDAS